MRYMRLVLRFGTVFQFLNVFRFLKVNVIDVEHTPSFIITPQLMKNGGNPFFTEYHI